MIAQYNGIYCCIDITSKPLQIWTYIPVNGFRRNVTPRGTVYYDQYVGVGDLERVFDVAFAVKYNGEWFGCDYSPKTQTVILSASDIDIINKYKFHQIERGVYELVVDVSMCQEFKVTYRDFHTKKYESQIVSFSEWQTLWDKLVFELLPQ